MPNESLSGITVGNVPLEKIIKDAKKAQEDQEVSEVRKQAIKAHQRPRRVALGSYVSTGRSGQTKVIRIFEGEIMNLKDKIEAEIKSGGTIRQVILLVLMEGKPRTVREIVERIGECGKVMNTGNVSAALIGLSKAKVGRILIRDTTVKPMQWSLRSETKGVPYETLVKVVSHTDPYSLRDAVKEHPQLSPLLNRQAPLKVGLRGFKSTKTPDPDEPIVEKDVRVVDVIVNVKVQLSFDIV